MAKRKGAAQAEDAPVNNYERLTGVALTTEASRDSGFSNFRLCTVFIVDGEIVHVERSQEFALFEVIARFEIQMERANWHLSNGYRSGHYMTLGSEDRDRLVNRLKAEDPELLAKIAPALGMQQK